METDQFEKAVFKLMNAALDQPRPTRHLARALNKLLQLTQHPQRLVEGK
jgi:hypothetical protein